MIVRLNVPDFCVILNEEKQRATHFDTSFYVTNLVCEYGVGYTRRLFIRNYIRVFL